MAMVHGDRGALASSLGWLLMLLGIVVTSSVFALLSQGCYVAGSGEIPAPAMSAVALSALVFVGIGRLLTARRADNRISWVIAGVGFGLPLSLLLPLYADCAIQGRLALPGAALAAWLAPFAALAGLFSLFVLLPAWFPDGRFLSGRWARLIWALLAAALGLSVLGGLAPGNLESAITGRREIENPFGVPWELLGQLKPALVAGPAVLVSLGALLAIVAFARRFRQAAGEPRQQLTWFAFFLSTVVVVHILGFEIGGILLYPAVFGHWSYAVIIVLSAGGFPLVIGLAIFKYRLYDIDLIIRRTISYAALIALLAAVYFGGVVLLQATIGALTGNIRSPVVVVASTLGIAALFNPLRRRVQDFIDRRFYRARYNAEQTLARFAAAARDEVDVDQLAAALLGVVEETLRPAHASLWLKPLPRPPAGDAHAGE